MVAKEGEEFVVIGSVFVKKAVLAIGDSVPVFGVLVKFCVAGFGEKKSVPVESWVLFFCCGHGSAGILAGIRERGSMDVVKMRVAIVRTRSGGN